MPKRKRKTEDTELIAVITAAIAAAREAEAPVPVITSVRERKAPEPAIAAARESGIPTAATGAAREEETRNPTDSFVARTIKRRGRRR